MIRVIDLNAGLGGRVLAFLKAGYDVVAAYDNDPENCRYLSKMLGEERVKEVNIMDVEPSYVEDADIYMFKIIQQSFSKAENVHGRMNINDAFFSIIKDKCPKYILIEAPISMLKMKPLILENYFSKLQRIGYVFSYQICNERDYVGIPVYGKQVFFIGVRGSGDERFVFPTFNLTVNRAFKMEDAVKIDNWYRKVAFDTSNMELNKWYLKVQNNVSEVSEIHMGAMRENYVVDRIGPRRFTHNELASVKGLVGYDYNECTNRRKMYDKIAYASNTYVVLAIANSMRESVNDSKNKFPELIQCNDREDKDIKSRKTKTEKVVFPKLRLRNVYIEKLKGLTNVEITFNKSLTAIMGINGAGKSTILHALACVYSRYEKGEDYKFSYFFTPNPDALWVNSSFRITNYDENTDKEVTKHYKKNAKRWINYSKRPKRDVYYFGIDTCIPEIEREKKTTYINYVSNDEQGKHVDNILKDASYIMQIEYEKLFANHTSSKEYTGVSLQNGLTYSSLSMGAGEQRVIKLLKKLYDANRYSLFLIDEIDLLLHVDALKKLVQVLNRISEEKSLQIVFTTHSLEMQKMLDMVDIKYLEHAFDQVLVYDSINPDLLYELSGEIRREYTIYVEDDFAESIVNKVLGDNNFRKYVSIIQFGSITNAFSIAASEVIRNTNMDKVLIVIDGDRYATTDLKLEQINRHLSGNEPTSDERRAKAISLITQFNTLDDKSPEEYIYSMLIELEEKDEIVQIAKSIKVVSDKHEYIQKIVEQMGDRNQTYYRILDLVSKSPQWDSYVANIRNWIEGRRDNM